MKLHELRPCTNKHGKGEQQSLYCIRNCRWCRTADFSKQCTKSKHITCWQRHLPQEQEDDDLHEPLDPLQRLYVEAVTYSEKKNLVQDRLHEQDRIAQWFTIKSAPSERSLPRLNVTDRFRKLCNPGALPNEYSSRQFPGFVSFIGDTGIGKSTLSRAMILMGHLDPSGTQYKEDDTHLEENTAGLRNALAQNAYGPVSRSGSTSQMTNPTSFGVHLYKDIAAPTYYQTDDSQFSRDTPLLFADCEGFAAGHTLTNAQLADTGAFTPNLIMDLPITAESYGKFGKVGVDLFYARFLYTISDVVVLVTDADTQFFLTMQRLVEWAASAVYHSVNHLAQKTLIIVRNMATLNDNELYLSKTLKERLLNQGLPKFWENSPLLKKFVDNFNNKQDSSKDKITDNNDLLNKLFSKVRACNIPDTRTVPLDTTFRQYQDLRYQIVKASQLSQRLRSKNWMQYNVPMLSHIFNNAFEHFRTSNDPFDFYQAARNDNPNPVSVSDHISNFIRHLHLHSDFPPEMIPKVIAVCLITWARRSFKLGE